MKAIELDPEYAEAHYDLSLLLKKRFHDPLNAKKHYLEAIRLNPSLGGIE